MVIPLEALAEHNLKLSRILTCKSLEELRTVPGFPSWYAEEVRTLGEQWTKTRAVLGRNFGGAFSSRLLTFVFQKFIAEAFERAFVESSFRVLS